MTEKRKRAAPTIDLKATEVPAAVESASAHEQAASPPPEPPRHKAKQDTKSEPPPPPKEPPSFEIKPPPAASPIATYGVPLAAGLAGAIIGGAIVWALLPTSSSSSDDAQVAALRKEINDLKTRPASGDAQAVAALRDRIGKIEHDIASLQQGDASMAERLNAADGAMKSLGVALSALNKRSDDAATNAKQAGDRAAAAEQAVRELRDSVSNARQQASNAADAGQLAAVQQRIGALEQSVKDAHAQLAQAATSDKAARLALSATALRDAVERGAPYAAELAQAKALGADDAALAPLVSFAEKGVPSRQVLAQQLTELMPALIKAANVEEAPSGFLGRLQANASNLVRFSAINAPAGDKPADVLARIELAAAHDDIDAALADIGKLPEKARQQVADWVTKAVARQKAIAAAAEFASSSTRALQP
jgi:hypothetical protein